MPKLPVANILSWPSVAKDQLQGLLQKFRAEILNNDPLYTWPSVASTAAKISGTQKSSPSAMANTPSLVAMRNLACAHGYTSWLAASQISA